MKLRTFAKLTILISAEFSCHCPKNKAVV